MSKGQPLLRWPRLDQESAQRGRVYLAGGACFLLVGPEFCSLKKGGSAGLGCAKVTQCSAMLFKSALHRFSDRDCGQLACLVFEHLSKRTSLVTQRNMGPEVGGLNIWSLPVHDALPGVSFGVGSQGTKEKPPILEFPYCFLETGPQDVGIQISKMTFLG